MEKFLLKKLTKSGNITVQFPLQTFFKGGEELKLSLRNAVHAGFVLCERRVCLLDIRYIKRVEINFCILYFYKLQNKNKSIIQTKKKKKQSKNYKFDGVTAAFFVFSHSFTMHVTSLVLWSFASWSTTFCSFVTSLGPLCQCGSQLLQWQG